MITIGNTTFKFLFCYAAAFNLENNNSRPVHCKDCKGDILTGLGIYRKQYRHNGYLCFSCFSSHIKVMTRTASGDLDAGFTISKITGNLQACVFLPKQFPTDRIIQLVYEYLYEKAYTAVDSLVGSETADITRIGDLADAIIG
jgi:hypothetical protein